jgi:molybdenum ABC transporter molybdate-binding protein
MPSPHPRRFGRLSLAWLAFLGSAGLVALLVALLAFDLDAWPASKGDPPRSLVVFCAAGLRAPVEAAARAYGEKYGVEVQLQYGGSNTHLATIQAAGLGDLYIPADDSYVRTARDKGVIAEVLPLAKMKPVLAVRKRNPQSIRSLDDLLSRKLRVAQANPEAAAIGKVAREALGRAGQWKPLQERTVVTKPTVTDVAADVALGSVDAGVVWDVTLRQVEGLDAVPAPAFDAVSATVSACVVRASRQPTAALHFARYLAARDRGLVEFARAGFAVVDGDRWAETPELHLLAGAMLRPAIEETITAFEEREGVKVTRVYNGCGILVAQMRAGRPPDAFFACDKEFMGQVRDLFGPATTVSGNQLVILVHKGNPHGIQRLKDLGKPGLRVGVGHEKQCAMGLLTQQTLKEDKADKTVMKNVKVQSPTGDMLVNQMRTGSLDAAIAYISNAAGSADVLEAVPIDIPCAFAEQPFAVAKLSDFPHLTSRLLDAIRSAESRERFEAFGFTWKGPPAGGKTGRRGDRRQETGEGRRP